MTKADFASVIRLIQKTSRGQLDEQPLYDLSDDLGYIEELARGFSEERLKELEADPNGRLW